jgi:uncharacterized SAM-binding protein YcdF (DUF218 family)
LAENLVVGNVLEPSEAIVVLTGSKSGNRLEAGVKLMDEGLGKVLIFSGFQVYPRRFTNQMMVDHARQLGIPPNKIITQISKGKPNTWGEAIANLNLMKQNDIHKFILVTSGFHTKRSHRAYKKLVSQMGFNMDFLVYPAEDPDFPIEGWWKSKAGRNMIFLEYLKTIAYYIEH